jgi:hypothetical protein
MVQMQLYSWVTVEIREKGIEQASMEMRQDINY